MQRIFPHIANHKQDRKMHARLRQGQTMSLSAHHLAQRAVTQWGRDTSTPNALKTMHFKQTFVDFHTLAT